MCKKLLGLSIGHICLLGLGLLLISRIKNRKGFSFKSKVVVITGGSRGLGLAIARELGNEGARIAIIAHDEKALIDASNDLKSRGIDVTTWSCDLRDEENVTRIISEIGNEYGRIDVVINNAGIIVVAPFDQLTKEDFEEAMATHFWAPLNVINAALPWFKRNKESRIVNIGSIGGKISVPHLASYCASKFALTGLSDTLRSELARNKIFVTTVSPGLMRTGSHIHARFKGNCEKEYTWFSLAAATPLLSIGAKRAVRKIVNAARVGQPDLTITLVAKVAVIFKAIAPNLFAWISAFGNELLPSPKSSRKKKKALEGKDCKSPLAPSVLTTLADQAAIKFNQVR